MQEPYEIIESYLAGNERSLRRDHKRNDPRRAFEGQSYETPWDDLHIAFFDSYALWTYLTIPFLYTYPGKRWVSPHF
jgi:hypothetical protein